MLMEENLSKYQGLTSLEAKKRLFNYGPNIVREKQPNRLIIFVKKFWSPIPWMLEITILLQLALRKYDEAIIITAFTIIQFTVEFFSRREGK